MVRNSLYAHGLLLDLCLFCSSRPKGFSTCLACSTINSIAISPKESRYSCRDRLLFLVETISGTRLQDPPMLLALAHFFLFKPPFSLYSSFPSVHSFTIGNIYTLGVFGLHMRSNVGSLRGFCRYALFFLSSLFVREVA